MGLGLGLGLGLGIGVRGWHQYVGVHHTQRRVEPSAFKPLAQREFHPAPSTGCGILGAAIEPRAQSEDPHGCRVASWLGLGLGLA